MPCSAKAGSNPVVEQIGSGDRGLGGVELGCGPLRVGVDKGLLVDAPHTLNGAHIERVLGPQIARMGGVDLAVGQIVILFALQGHHLRFGEHRPRLGNVLLQGAEPRRSQTQRTPEAETNTPRLRSSLDTRTWPQAGCSRAISQMVASVASSTRFLRFGLRRVGSSNACRPPSATAVW